VLPDNLVAYTALTLLVCLTPGPAVLFVVGQASWRGPRAGFAAAFGILVGNLVYWALSAFGLIAVIAASGTFFMALKYAGAVYLAWLGVTAIISTFRPVSAPPSQRPAMHGFRDGALVQLANPKAVLFFVALLPQFIDTDGAVTGQILILCLVGSIIEISVLSLYSLVGAALSSVMRKPAVRKWFDRSIGVLFIALAALAATYRNTA
jgi:homoserine/homoserine lactone efflux protein